MNDLSLDVGLDASAPRKPDTSHAPGGDRSLAERLPTPARPRSRSRKVPSGLPFGAKARPSPEDPIAMVELQGTMFPVGGLADLPLTGAKIRRIREGLGLTQTQFGALIDKSVVTVHRWESEQASPSAWTTDILTAFGAVLDHNTVGDSVRLALIQRGAVATLHELLSFVYVR